MVFVRLAAKARAPKFGEYPNSCTAVITLSRVDCPTLSGEFKHLDTVAVDTPANSATSASVGNGASGDLIGTTYIPKFLVHLQTYTLNHQEM
jgi:hypothetical protein